MTFDSRPRTNWLHFVSHLSRCCSFFLFFFCTADEMMREGRAWFRGWKKQVKAETGERFHNYFPLCCYKSVTHLFQSGMCNGSSSEHSQLLIQVRQPAGVGSESLLLSSLLFLYLWPTLREEKTEKKLLFPHSFHALSKLILRRLQIRIAVTFIT